MGRSNQAYKCYVCNKAYRPEKLGRCMMPMFSRRQRVGVYRVVCLTCYQAVVDAWPAEAWAKPPVLHGF